MWSLTLNQSNICFSTLGLFLKNSETVNCVRHRNVKIGGGGNRSLEALKKRK